jgi:hypothetical protein
MRSNTNDRRTSAAAAEVADKRAERQAVKDQISALQTIIDSITAATTLGDLRGYVKDLARVLRRVARILT